MRRPLETDLDGAARKRRHAESAHSVTESVRHAAFTLTRTHTRSPAIPTVTVGTLDEQHAAVQQYMATAQANEHLYVCDVCWQQWSPTDRAPIDVPAHDPCLAQVRGPLAAPALRRYHLPVLTLCVAGYRDCKAGKVPTVCLASIHCWPGSLALAIASARTFGALSSQGYAGSGGAPSRACRQCHRRARVTPAVRLRVATTSLNRTAAHCGPAPT
jgi:hypothetical protein